MQTKISSLFLLFIFWNEWPLQFCWISCSAQALWAFCLLGCGFCLLVFHRNWVNRKGPPREQEVCVLATQFVEGLGTESRQGLDPTWVPAAPRHVVVSVLVGWAGDKLLPWEAARTLSGQEGLTWCSAASQTSKCGVLGILLSVTCLKVGAECALCAPSVPSSSLPRAFGLQAPSAWLGMGLSSSERACREGCGHWAPERRG